MVQNFGIHRDIFGSSNSPIDRLQIEFAEMITLFSAALTPFGEDAAERFIQTSALDVYRLKV